MPSISRDLSPEPAHSGQMTLHASLRSGGVVLAVWALGVVGCSSGSGSLDLYGDGGTGGKKTTVVDEPGPGPVATDACTAKYPASQALSGPCCTERGADACGAGLFCAAFDGRTQPTCYAERSRSDGQTCTANIQCVNNACNSSGLCKSTTPTPGKCPTTCATNSDCQATCPVTGSSIACCDTVTTVCYQSSAGSCPVK